MDAGFTSSSSPAILKPRPRFPLQKQHIQKRRNSNHENLDRFIPNRSAMNMDFAHYMLTEGKKDKEENAFACSPSSQAYRTQLAEALNINSTRILAFKNKPPVPIELIPRQRISSKPHRHIPEVAKAAPKAKQEPFSNFARIR